MVERSWPGSGHCTPPMNTMDLFRVLFHVTRDELTYYHVHLSKKVNNQNRKTKTLKTLALPRFSGRPYANENFETHTLHGDKPVAPWTNASRNQALLRGRLSAILFFQLYSVQTSKDTGELAPRGVPGEGIPEFTGFPPQWAHLPWTWHWPRATTLESVDEEAFKKVIHGSRAAGPQSRTLGSCPDS